MVLFRILANLFIGTDAQVRRRRDVFLEGNEEYGKHGDEDFAFLFRVSRGNVCIFLVRCVFRCAGEDIMVLGCFRYVFCVYHAREDD